MSLESLEELKKYLDKRVVEVARELEIITALRDIVEGKISRASQAKPSEKDLPTILENLKWRRYSSGDGEWIYTSNIPREALEILRQNKKVEIDGYMYTYKNLDRVEVVSRKRVRRDGV